MNLRLTFTSWDLPGEHVGTAATLSPELAVRYAEEHSLTDGDLTLLSDEAFEAVARVRRVACRLPPWRRVPFVPARVARNR